MKIFFLRQFNTIRVHTVEKGPILSLFWAKSGYFVFWYNIACMVSIFTAWSGIAQLLVLDQVLKNPRRRTSYGVLILFALGTRWCTFALSKMDVHTIVYDGVNQGEILFLEKKFCEVLIIFPATIPVSNTLKSSLVRKIHAKKDLQVSPNNFSSIHKF